MFTGIITDLAEVTEMTPMETGLKVTLRTHFEMHHIPLGASIACDGACMTVVEKDASHFTVEISPESLDRTTLGAWAVGSQVNLERPVAVGGEFGGHFVTGHVDAVGEVTVFESQGEFWLLEIHYPAEFGIYLAEKGSVAVNGVSLTVNHVDRVATRFQLMIIPHTLQETNLGSLKKSHKVNLEADLIARYLNAQQEERSAA